MQDRETTVRSRALAAGCRKALTDTGLNGKQAADLLDWSEAKVSRLLTGKRGGSVLDVATFLGICRVSSAERERLIGIAREMAKSGWLQQFGERLPKQLATLIDHEDNAETISDFQCTVMPGLLQTGDYARSLSLGTRTLPEEEIDDRVAARLARQSLLSRRTPSLFTFFIHEFVLRLPVGGPMVMSGQLHQLLQLAVRPKIKLRVVPASIGSHPGIAGPFKLMEFTDIKPVVYLDSETSSLFLEEPDEIRAYRRILAVLADTALDEGQSRELIADLAVELYGNREDDHAPPSAR